MDEPTTTAPSRTCDIHLDRRRAIGLAYINPNFAKPASGIVGEDSALLLGDSARARTHDVDYRLIFKLAPK